MAVFAIIILRAHFDISKLAGIAFCVFFFLPIFWEIVTAETANSLNHIYTHLTTHLVERATSFNVVAIFQHIAKSRYDSDSIYID